MNGQRLSDKMSAKSRAVEDAIEVLQDATIEAINFHFDAGQQAERERIIKLLEDWDVNPLIIAEVKGEN